MPKPAAVIPYAKAIHEIWQVDGLESAELASGGRICSITVSEEKSRSLLYEDVFPCQMLSQLEGKQIKAYFECVFGQYGLPQMIKVDNGYPWKDPKSDLPTNLALWWIGLGINVRWNRPYRPQENAVVENNNGLVARWAEIHEKHSIEEVKNELEWIGTYQREKIPVRRYKGKTRLEKYPELYQIQRPYSEELFNFERCKQFLQDNYKWIRHVNKSGQINFWGTRVYVGKTHGKVSVTIQYFASKELFEIRDEQNTVLKTFLLKGLNTQATLDFTLFQRTNSNTE